MQQQDQRIAYEVERAISRLPGVRISDLQVTAARGHVRIQGVVPTLEDKQSVMRAAARVNGVLGLTEAIAVETRPGWSNRDHNRALEEALDEEEAVDVARVGAIARGGMTRLVGEATGIGELGRAAEIAEGVPGTVNTLDNTRIANPYGADPIDLVNAVAEAFGRDPVLRHRSIQPVLEGTGKLVLTGTVHSPGERLRALEIAAEIPGVHTVRADLEVTP